MLWRVRHRWSAGAQFAINCYKNWAQLLFCQPGGGGVRAAAPDLLAPFYEDNSAFNGLIDISSSVMTLLLERGPERVKFPELTKSLFICDPSAQEEAYKETFES